MSEASSTGSIRATLRCTWLLRAIATRLSAGCSPGEPTPTLTATPTAAAAAPPVEEDSDLSGWLVVLGVGGLGLLLGFLAAAVLGRRSPA